MRLDTGKVYSYDDQPTDNVAAWRLGEACIDAMGMSAGDYIDRGLGLLKALQAKGFGVVLLNETKESK